MCPTSSRSSKSSDSSTPAQDSPSDQLWVRTTFQVANLKGLHARPCAEIAKCAGRFRSQIYLRFEGKRVEAKSLLGLLTLAAGIGSQIEVEAKGIDAKQAVTSIAELAVKQFGIEY